MTRFKIERKPFDDDHELFEKDSVAFNPGITAITGCNGSGKTTLLNQIMERLENRDAPYVFLSEYELSNSNATDTYMFTGRSKMLAKLFSQSTGQNLYTNLKYLQISKIMELILTNKNKNIFIIVDGIDEGLSINAIDEFKKLFENLIELSNKNSSNKLYIIMAVNAYEFTRSYICIDSESLNRVKFTNYGEYANYVRESYKHLISKNITGFEYNINSQGELDFTLEDLENDRRNKMHKN